jgi:alkaline phosphatase
MPSFRNRLSGLLLLLACISVLNTCLQASDRLIDQPPQSSSKPAVSYQIHVQNVILLIGDGMSLAVVDAARFHEGGNSGKLQLDRMPVTGLVRTCSADKLVTDSAASATALSTGQKTKNGMLGMTPDRRKWMTLLEACQSRGMVCGLLATSSITHATPAAFASHIDNRKGQDEIAEQLLEHKVDVLLGGGKAYFQPHSARDSKRKDKRDLLAEAREKGYEVVLTRDAMMGSKSLLVLGLFALEGMKTTPPEPSLAEMAVKAMESLSARAKGFFLMIEGSQIDWAAHRNDAEGTIRQTLDFDAAVGRTLDFAAANGHTLVLVTADHETGGAAVTGGNLNGLKIKIGWSTRGHAAGSAPLFAFGPGAEQFTGFQENTDIPIKTARLLKIEPFPVLLNP